MPSQAHPGVPFGGYKQSGIGRECGEYALAEYVARRVPRIARSMLTTREGLMQPLKYEVRLSERLRADVGWD